MHAEQTGSIHGLQEQPLARSWQESDPGSPLMGDSATSSALSPEAPEGFATQLPTIKDMQPQHILDGSFPAPPSPSLPWLLITP